MDRLTVTVGVLVLAAALAGCLGGEDEKGTVVFDLAVHPQDDDVQNRSDIDDFETLQVSFDEAQVYAANDSSPEGKILGKSFDLTEVVESGSQRITQFRVDPDRHHTFMVRPTVVEAVHENGSEPDVHTSIYRQFYNETSGPYVGAGETLRWKWVFAVTQDTEDIGNPNVPEGDYFLRTVVGTGPVN